MKRDEQTIVSLETHRRRRLAESRKKPARPPPGRSAVREPMVNWRRAPLAIGLFAALALVSWLISHIGG